MNTRIPKSKLEKSEELRKQMEDFVKKGGKVQEIPTKSEHEFNPNKRAEVPRGQNSFSN